MRLPVVIACVLLLAACSSAVPAAGVTSTSVASTTGTAPTSSAGPASTPSTSSTPAAAPSSSPEHPATDAALAALLGRLRTPEGGRYDVLSAKEVARWRSEEHAYLADIGQMPVEPLLCTQDYVIFRGSLDDDTARAAAGSSTSGLYLAVTSLATPGGSERALQAFDELMTRCPSVRVKDADGVHEETYLRREITVDADASAAAVFSTSLDGEADGPHIVLAQARIGELVAEVQVDIDGVSATDDDLARASTILDGLVAALRDLRAGRAPSAVPSAPESTATAAPA